MVTSDLQYGMFTAHDGSFDTARRVWRAAEEEGLSAIGIVDSPLLMPEAFLSLATAAIDTSRIRIFSSVLNTLTRDPTVTAGGLFGLNELAPGRAFLAFGAGDSSTFGVGLGHATLAQMSEYITAVRALLHGEKVTYQGRTLKGAWKPFEPLDVKLYMAAHGPKALATAGQVADGVLCGFGLLPETIAYAESTVRESAERAGRDPQTIEIWYLPFFCPAPTREQGFLWSNGCGAAVLSRPSLDGKLVPADKIRGIEEVGRTWTLDRHARANPDTLAVAQRTGVLDYLIARGGSLVGPIDDGVKIIRELHEFGARNLLFVALGDNKLDLIRQLGQLLRDSAIT